MMVKRVLFLLVLITVCFNTPLWSYSARSEIHKYGFVALGDDISTISYNPAGLFYLPKTYAELTITSDKNFKYNQLALGYYLTRFPFLSKIYWTSINLSVGMTKIEENEEFSVGLGGTLIDFIKYGVLFNYNKNNEINKKYFGANVGTIINLIKWLKIGFTAINIEDKLYSPLSFITGINIIIIKELRLTFGANFDKNFKETKDYSGAAELNLFKNLYILTGIQKNIIPFGFGLNFSLEEYKNSRRARRVRYCYREKISVAFNYDKLQEKITKIIVSFNYRFHSFIHPPYIPGKRLRRVRVEESYIDEEEKVMDEKDIILEEQRDRLERAKIYFAEGRYDEAKDEIEEILKLDRKTRYAKEALKIERKIKRIKRLKRR